MNTFRHIGDLGDLVFALPTIRACFGGTLFIAPGQGTREAMTPSRMEAIKPLLLAQEYIEKVEWHRGESVRFNFTDFRRNSHTKNQTLAESQRIEVLPMNTVDFSKPWLTVGEYERHGRVVIARSARYHNAAWSEIWPDIVRRHPDALFVGLPEEHEAFVAEFGEVEFRQTADLLELAKVIAGASLFIGNQSCPNAIAEGLKKDSILEVDPKQPDCIFPRKNAKHIRTVEEWGSMHPTPKLMLALQFWPGDAKDAIELAQLITDNETRFRSDVEFAIVARFDVDQRDVERIERIVSERFNSHVIRSLPGEKATGWPYGCNALWRALMAQIAGLGGTRVKSSATAVLTFEPDCCPLRRDWIDALVKEWARCEAQGKRCFGTILPHVNGTHLNGNAVFSRNFAKEVPVVQKEAGGAWDGAFAPQILPVAMDSPLIVQRYGERGDVPFEDLDALRSGEVVPAFIHGIKTDAARQYFRKEVMAGK